MGGFGAATIAVGVIAVNGNTTGDGFGSHGIRIGSIRFYYGPTGFSRYRAPDQLIPEHRRIP